MGRLKSIEKRIEPARLDRGAPIAQERIRGHKLTVIRKRILMRDCYTCRVCGIVSTDLQIDHIVPLHLGGRESDENRQCLCHTCHDLKSQSEEEQRSGGGVNLRGRAR